MNKAKYLIVGSGRVAKHFQFYFTQLHLRCRSWDRTQDLSILKEELKTSTHVLLLISDSAIEMFYKKHIRDHISSSTCVIHFSGALDLPFMYGVHPLMAFGPRLYPLEYYIKIPFVLDQSEKKLKELLPGISNRSFVIKPEQKPLYHCLCVLAGNFPHVLWSQMSAGLEEMGLPRDVAHMFLKANLENFILLGSKSLTGPLVRKDAITVEKNLDSLSEKPLLKEIYFQFIKLSWPDYFNNK